MLFDNEKEQLKILNNQRAIFSNIHYRIQNDENVKQFFKSLKYYIDNYDNLEHMEKYYFNKKFEDIFELLRMFINYSINDGFFKNKNADEITEPCIVLSDSNGLSFIKIVGYFSILSFFNKKITAEKYKSKMLSDNDLKELNNFEEKRIQNSRMINLIHNPEQEIKNFSLINAFYSKKFNDYKENEANNVESLLKSISKILSENNDDNIVKLGKEYWDSRLEKKKEEIKKFSELFKILANNLENKEKES
tara:strand:+ start:12787 stop:13533 length:747 start_codon:yes stop_codon:yes gene_type:complete